MLLEQLLRTIEARLGLRVFPYLCHGLRFHRWSLVAETITNICEYTCEFLVVQQRTEGSHRRHTFVRIVVNALHRDRSHESVQGELDQAFFTTGDPFTAGERRINTGQALAIRLVADGAMGIAREDFLAHAPEFEIGSGELR